jgi:hypothetical protein
MPVCPSASKNPARTGGVLINFCILVFKKSVENIQVSLKSDKKNGHFT